MLEMCSMLTIKTTENVTDVGVSVVNSKQISNISLVFPLSTLKLPAGNVYLFMFTFQLFNNFYSIYIIENSKPH